jgi:hypothetical protein
MEIFNKQIFGSDAESFLTLCKEEKKQWILDNTSQKNDILIDEFIKNPKISKECKCLDCGKNKSNESNPISAKASKVAKPINTTRNSAKDSNKRQSKPKTA